jgi:hypothetical protein
LEENFKSQEVRKSGRVTRHPSFPGTLPIIALKVSCLMNPVHYGHTGMVGHLESVALGQSSAIAWSVSTEQQPSELAMREH